MDQLDKKLTGIFEGRVVRKDLLHRIKKGTNVPTFVLEFLLARYCASDDPAEIQAGMEAVLATLQENYVRPDEFNAAVDAFLPVKPGYATVLTWCQCLARTNFDAQLVVAALAQVRIGEHDVVRVSGRRLHLAAQQQRILVGDEQLPIVLHRRPATAVHDGVVQSHAFRLALEAHPPQLVG